MLGLMEVGEDGDNGIDVLHEATLSSFAEGDEVLPIRYLSALGNLCLELECSEHLGAIGGHQSILRLMTERETPARVAKAGTDDCQSLVGPREDEIDSGDESEVQAAAAQVAACVVASGCTFPMRASSGGGGHPMYSRLPVRYDFTISENRRDSSLMSNSKFSCKSGVTASTGEASNEWKLGHNPKRVTAKNFDRRISVLVRPVKERQQSQFDVGFQMWPAAVILSRWLCRNPHVLGGRRVLEVGSGLGLCGIVAAHMAADVTLSDFNPVVLRALEASVALNAGWDVAQKSFDSPPEVKSMGENCPQRVRLDCGRRVEGINTTVAIETSGMVRVRHLDWDKLDVPEEAGSSACNHMESVPTLAREGNLGVDNKDRFDVIIASDHICQVRSHKDG